MPRPTQVIGRDGKPVDGAGPILKDGERLRVGIVHMDAAAVRDVTTPHDQSAATYMCGGRMVTMDALDGAAAAAHHLMMEELSGDRGLARRLASAAPDEAAALAAQAHAEMVAELKAASRKPYPHAWSK